MTSNERPLPTPSLYILLALSESHLHGYGILQSVKRQSVGRYRMGPGTLYANLATLLANGLVAESQRRLKDGETRREYRLTAAGERVLRLEIRRLRQIIFSARRWLGKLDEKDA
jgi:DNA-binding PadR family transcriptional regulator